MDKSRQQFEETIKSLSDTSEFESKLKRANNGLNYADRDVDLMWISWQASRESLEVELPEGFGVHEIWCYTAASVENALISNGVKIKNG
ncbi:hypothetical protein [Providencia alcalifaciens]|uniref:hypothetical protein n=1 Tax=Providencia alcalifaciens TaxID=126385 RepID=UPI00045201E6|nr:hypothetical protein [Providencia alcalifaciens]EUD08717.1 hypothetical protein HMPREF1564_3594 [Providencia alcalifaciens R90-1475]